MKEPLLSSQRLAGSGRSLRPDQKDSRFSSLVRKRRPFPGQAFPISNRRAAFRWIALEAKRGCRQTLTVLLEKHDRVQG